MQSISKKMEHLYFPINWSAPLVNSRALAYLIGRNHPRLCIQLQAMFHNRLQLVFVTCMNINVILHFRCDKLSHSVLHKCDSLNLCLL